VDRVRWTKHTDASVSQDPTSQTDISTLTASTLASYDANLWLMSPACQPYTVLNPNAQGAADPRAKSFLHLIRDVLPELAVLGKHPTHLLIENVTGFEVRALFYVLLCPP
jgi:tRNA (cytosine38-C5)-methyltransferase